MLRILKVCLSKGANFPIRSENGSASAFFAYQARRGLVTSPYLNPGKELLHPQAIWKCRDAITKCLEEDDPATANTLQVDLYCKLKEILKFNPATAHTLATSFMEQAKHAAAAGTRKHIAALSGNLFLNGKTYRIRYLIATWNCLRNFSSPVDFSFSSSDSLLGLNSYRHALSKLPLTIWTMLDLAKASLPTNSAEYHIIETLQRKYLNDAQVYNNYKHNDVFDCLAFCRHSIVHPPLGISEQSLIDVLDMVFQDVYPLVQKFHRIHGRVQALEYISPLLFTGVWEF